MLDTQSLEDAISVKLHEKLHEKLHTEVQSMLVKDADSARTALVSHFQLPESLTLSQVACEVIGMHNNDAENRRTTLLRGIAETAQDLLAAYNQLINDATTYADNNDMVMVQSALSDARQKMNAINARSEQINKSLDR
jgi:hypothetical protein